MRYLLPMLFLAGCGGAIVATGRCVSVSDETLVLLARTNTALALDDASYGPAVTRLGREDDVREQVTVALGAAQARVVRTGAAEDATIVRHAILWLQVHRQR